MEKNHKNFNPFISTETIKIFLIKNTNIKRNYMKIKNKFVKIKSSCIKIKKLRIAKNGMKKAVQVSDPNYPISFPDFV